MNKHDAITVCVICVSCVIISSFLMIEDITQSELELCLDGCHKGCLNNHEIDCKRLCVESFFMKNDTKNNNSIKKP